MIFFRADSNKQIASGHIMRCIAIAQAFCEAGFEVRFLVADDNPVQMLENAGVEYTILHSTWNNLMSEVEVMKTILQASPNSLLIIDTYQVSRQYVEALLPFGRICYLGSKPEYLGKLKALVNYSTDIDYEFYNSNYNEETKLLLGAAFAPLRKEFMQINHHVNSDNYCRILLTTGNTDPKGYVNMILEEIVRSDYLSQIEVNVIVGGMFDNKEILHSHFDNIKEVVLHENVKSMSSLMAMCDLAVSANGTTVYELAAAKVPVISFAMVEEQVKSANKLSELGVVDYCGEIFSETTTVIERIIKHISVYVEKPVERALLAEKAHSIIDGKGCERIVEILKNI